MPSRLRKQQDIPVDRIDLEDGDWVRVRRWLTAKDRDQINHKLTKLNMEEGTGSFKTENANRTNALQVLVEWGGPGFCVDDHSDTDGNALDVSEGHQHRSVEITFDNVSALHDQDLRKIINHISRRNPRAIAPTGTSNGTAIEQGEGEAESNPFPEETPAGVS